MLAALLLCLTLAPDPLADVTPHDSRDGVLTDCPRDGLPPLLRPEHRRDRDRLARERTSGLRVAVPRPAPAVRPRCAAAGHDGHSAAPVPPARNPILRC